MGLRPCIEAYKGCSYRFDETNIREGVIFQVRDLLRELRTRVWKGAQLKMLGDPKFAYERRILLGREEICVKE